MKLKVIIFITVIIAITISYTVISFRESAIAGYVEDYQKMTYRIERDFIENVPVYRDFAKPALISELKKFDLEKHRLQVKKYGTTPLRNMDDINESVKKGELVPAGSGSNEYYYFHNVRKEYRYLTPPARDALRMVAGRFQEKIKSHKSDLPVVKLAISSVIRTVNYQEKIFGRKFVSLHSFGVCFDIFFDDYYIKIPEPEKHEDVFDRLRKSLQRRTGFLMGDALREQLRTVLMETLLELQREGGLYVFLEEDNRCYHITILPGKR
ncbi:MAG TPA: DUF5715 family protein [Spirochaetota bacterium]|nr:DUF5715 family protein [Spirochaetota bacterium]HPJ35427.1 DUF5715 family protein [Spirochaetota bacterium]